jgi:hypothetical protein
MIKDLQITLFSKPHNVVEAHVPFVVIRSVNLHRPPPWPYALDITEILECPVFTA